MWCAQDVKMLTKKKTPKFYGKNFGVKKNEMIWINSFTSSCR